MKKIINILLVMLNEAVFDCFTKEAMEKLIRGYSLWDSRLNIGEMITNKKNMGFIQKYPYNIWVSPDLNPKEGIVSYNYKKTERGLVATSISYITEEEVATKIWEEILPIAEEKAAAKRKIEAIKASGDIKKFIKGVIPFINKFEINEEEEYNGWSLGLYHESVKGTFLYIKLNEIEGTSLDFSVDINTEDDVFAYNREEILPEMGELFHAIVEEILKRKEEAKKKGEEIPNWGRSYSPKEEITEEEIQNIINNSINC